MNFIITPVSNLSQDAQELYNRLQETVEVKAAKLLESESGIKTYVQIGKTDNLRTSGVSPEQLDKALETVVSQYATGSRRREHGVTAQT